jgi:small GTP-binding protein
MAMPHEVQFKKIKEHIRNLDGKAKIIEIEKLINELPYESGPYSQIKHWLRTQISITKTRSKAKFKYDFGIKREGQKQFVLVGLPNIGKSSLLNKLSGLQTKIADYEFTTLDAIPGIIKINSAEFQLIDLPGLIEGATDDKGKGKRFLGIIKNSDGIILMHDLTKDIEEIDSIINELKINNIDKPMIILGTKIDLNKDNLQTLKQKFNDLQVIGVSNIDEKGYPELKDALWNISDLIRVFGKDNEIPFILAKESTVEDIVKKIHSDLLQKFKYAKVSGSSTKYPNQQVGKHHKLEDLDKIELFFES